MRATLIYSSVMTVLFGLSANAAIITTGDGAGSDVAMRRNNASESDVFLRIKNGSRNGVEDNQVDRIGVLNFDTSLETSPVINAAVVVTTDLDGDNQFLAGETLFLYGIADGGDDENYTSTSFSDFAYSTGVNGAADPRPGTDLLANNVNDDTALLLDSILLDAPTVAGEPIMFRSSALTAFVASDTNGIASFILTVSESEILNTAVIASEENSNQLPPTLLTNGDVPEPTCLVMAALALLGVLGRRQSLVRSLR